MIGKKRKSLKLNYPKNILKGGKPFFYFGKGKNKKIGILLLHGYTSTPQEVSYLSNYLNKSGYTVYAPLIAGHGTNIKNLEKSKNQDWLNSAYNAYCLIEKYCDRIFIAGSSFGANLAILNFKKYDDNKIKGYLFLGMPIRHKERFWIDVGNAILPLITFFKPYSVKKYPKQNNITIIQKTKVHYTLFPLKKAKEVVEMIDETLKKLPQIKKPCIVMQSDNDHHFDEKNANLIMRHLGTKDKTFVNVHNQYHVFILDTKREKYFKIMGEFIRKYANI